MTRLGAIIVLTQIKNAHETMPKFIKRLNEKMAEERIEALDLAIESLSADTVSRDEYIKVLEESIWESEQIGKLLEYQTEEAEPKWITDSKPTEEGTYMVTLDAFGQHRYIKLMFYGKPLIPDRKVKGMCWYDCDSEWGDIVYDDDEILAWLPLPTPYGESEVEE